MRFPLEVVMLNYRRPANIAVIVDALRSQTILPRLTLIDQSGQDEFRVPPKIRSAFDRTIDISFNHGCFARYAIAPLLDCPYTLFLDDDMLPGSKCIEHFLYYAEMLSDEYSVLGQIGRLLPESLIYEPIDVPRSHTPLPMDFVVRGSCYVTERLTVVDQFRRASGISAREDDIVAQVALQLATHLPACLLPQDTNNLTLANWQELSDPFANSSQPGHSLSRRLTVAQAIQYGYIPLRLRTYSSLPTRRWLSRLKAVLVQHRWKRKLKLIAAQEAKL